MKKILFLLMLLSMPACLAVGVVGCGGSSSTPTGVAEDEQEVLTPDEEAGERAIGKEE